MLEFYHYFFSPFKRPKIRFYFGKTKIGVPYFFPRRVVKDPQNPGRTKFVPKKIGFDFCKLGWKTKWTGTDYRFEWSPVVSFVFFGYQLALIIEPIETDHYWEAWLFYHLATDNKKSIPERIIQCVSEFPKIYLRKADGVDSKIDYYQVILKEKWRPKSLDEIRDSKIDSIFKNKYI